MIWDHWILRLASERNLAPRLVDTVIFKILQACMAVELWKYDSDG